MLEYIHSFHNNVPSGLLLALLVLLIIVVCLVAHLKISIRNGIRITTLFLLFEYIFLIFCVTVFFREVYQENNGVDLGLFNKYYRFFDCTGEVGREIVSNILMFIPIGVIASIVFIKYKFASQLIIALAVSLSVEVSQLLFNCGLCEMNDLLHNVIGSICGYFIYILFRICRINYY